MSNKQLTRLWLANLFTAFRVIASRSQACKTDSSWVSDHENNYKQVFVIALDSTVASLLAITKVTQTTDGVTYTLETVVISRLVLNYKHLFYNYS